MNEAIEPLRRDKVLGSGLEARVTVPADTPLPADGLAGLAEILITGVVETGNGIQVMRTDHHKCGRCWRHLPEVAEDGALCARCEDAVAEIDGLPA